MRRTHISSTAISTTATLRHQASCSSGFTLVEALTALAVTSICLVIGVPSYQGFVENQRASAAMHLLTSHMASARNTAVSYRIPTVVCPSNQAGGCRKDGDWSRGWLMFFDGDGNRQPDLREDILRDENAPIHPSLRILSSVGRSQLRYLPDGRSSGTNLTVRLCREDKLLGRVIVNNAGRIRSEKASGSPPCTS